MAKKIPMDLNEHEKKYVKNKQDIVSISFQDEYGMRLRPTQNAPIFGKVVDIGIHPTNSSNPSEKLFSVLLKKTKSPLKAIRVPLDVCKKLKINKGDSIEYDIKEDIVGLPKNMFLVFCSDTAKNEEKIKQKENIENNLPDWIKKNYQSIRA